MSREEIFDKLKSILAMVKGMDVKEVECDETTHLLTGLGLNSIGMLYMVISIENQFQINFGNINIAEFDTVGKVIDYLEKAMDFKEKL